MAAETEKQIWDVTSWIERATEQVLAKTEVPEILLPHSDRALPESRLELMFMLGEAANQHTLPDGRKVYDFFQGGELRIKLATSRPMQQASLIPGVATMHAQFVATILEALDEGREPFCDLLPYHRVLTLRPLPVNRDLDARFMEDFTELRFQVDVAVKETAWVG